MKYENETLSSILVESNFFRQLSSSCYLHSYTTLDRCKLKNEMCRCKMINETQIQI